MLDDAKWKKHVLEERVWCGHHQLSCEEDRVLQLVLFVCVCKRKCVGEKILHPFTLSISEEWDWRGGGEQKVTLTGRYLGSLQQPLPVFHLLPWRHLSSSHGAIFICPYSKTQTLYPAVQYCPEGAGAVSISARLPAR